MDETDRAIEQAKREIKVTTLKALNKTAIIASQVLISSTPVKTGKARANWNASFDSPDSQVKEKFDKTGSATVAENSAIIASNTKEFRDIYISNNVPYIEPLNNGSSAQAPAGFVEKAVAIARRAGK